MNIGLFFTLREKACLPFLNVIPPFGEIVVNYPFNIGKTLNSIDLVNLMSSISVRFNSFSFFIRFSMNVIASAFAEWSVWMDSNHRPHAYQACALTT